jgi:hypothetical protein
MSSDKLGINAGRIDHGKAGDQPNEGDAPLQGCHAPSPGEPSAVTSLAVSIATVIMTTANGTPGTEPPCP